MLPTRILLYVYDWLNTRNLLNEYENLTKAPLYNLMFIHDYQQNRLKAIIDYVARNVFFYRGIWKECQIDNNMTSPVEIINKLPILTKDLLNSKFDDFLSDEYRNSKNIHFYYTGGSTGQPSKIAVDKNYMDNRWAMVYYNLTWVGYKLGDCHGFVYGSNLDAKEQVSFRQRAQHWLMNSFQVNAFFLNNSDLKGFANKCLKRKPRFIIGYASALFEFARYTERNGLPICFDFIESTAEYLSSEMKHKIEEVFHCKVYDRYGCREVGNIAHECKFRDGLHINWQNVYIEIINKGKYPWLDPEYGDIVVTCLKNKSMPLIRYFIGDLGKIDYSVCRCGMESPRLYLGGTRSVDILYTSDGTMVSASPLSLTTRDLYSIKKIQYIQKKINQLELNIITDHSDDNNIRMVLNDRLKKIFGNEVEIQFNFVDEIARELSGKYRLTKRLF